MVPDEINVYLWQEGFHLFFPMRARITGGSSASCLRPWRPGRCCLRGRDPSVRGEAGAALSFKSCTWFSTYRIHHRSAARFRDRRCFLLGDAAHIHSPSAPRA